MNEELNICPYCNGSGEGMYDGTRCSTCKGSGEISDEEPDDGGREDYEYERYRQRKEDNDDPYTRTDRNVDS